MPADENAKRHAARRAAEDIEDGWTIGLGTGSTANLFIEELAERIKNKDIEVTGVPTSIATEAFANQHDIPTIALNDARHIRLTVDGADEVDPANFLIKGGGGALTREKIVAAASRDYTVIVDESKLVKKLGAHFPVPLEVLPFAENAVFMELRELEGTPVVRKDFTTDNGNHIIYCNIDIDDPLDLEGILNNIPGVLENGIFAMTTPTTVYVGKKDGVDERH